MSCVPPPPTPPPPPLPPPKQEGGQAPVADGTGPWFVLVTESSLLLVTETGQWFVVVVGAVTERGLGLLHWLVTERGSGLRW